MIEKRGIIDENTPQLEDPHKAGCCGGICKTQSTQLTKESADRIEDNAATRAVGAVVDAVVDSARKR